MKAPAINLEALVKAQAPRNPRTGRPMRRRRRAPPLMRPIKARRVDEIVYRRQLLTVSQALEEMTQARLIPALQRLEPQYLRDSAATELQEVFGSLRAQVIELDKFARVRAEQMVGRVDQAHARRYFEEVRRVAGVDLAGIVSQERLKQVLEIKVQENVNLITSIPEQYFARLETLVMENVVTGATSAASLQSQIQALYGVTDNRARFIARDQTAKLNSAINTERNVASGIESYIWFTSRDSNVRPSHERLDTKIFHYGARVGSKGHPGPTGHPGEDYNCRCVPRSIVPGFPVPDIS